MKVLIIDDDAFSRRLLRYNLEWHGCDPVIEACDGQEGLQMAKDHHPELIISDALMPRMDGFQLLRMLQMEPELKSIPFVFHSSIYTGAKDEELAFSLGAAAFIPKPKVPEEFWQELTAVLNRIDANRQQSGVPELVKVEEEYLKEYSKVVAAKLQEKVLELEKSLEQRKQTEEKLLLQMENLSALRTIDSAINSSLDLRITLNVLLQQTIKQLRVDAACVLLFRPYSQMLEYAAGLGFNRERIVSTGLRLGQGYAGKAALERASCIIPDISATGVILAPTTLVEMEGFKAYVGVPLIAKGQIKGVLEIFHRIALHPEREWLEFAEALAGQAAIAIDNAELFDHLQRSHNELLMAYDITIEGWSRALDYRDKETEGHSRRVTEMTMKLARQLGLGDAELVHIRRGALLHDIGKLGVSDSILLKPCSLTEEEFGEMREHPRIAYKLLSPIDFLKPAIDIPYCHHEKWDGTGYPRGLQGEEIPLAARIFAVVDVWDALHSDRPYRSAWPAEQIREHIKSLAGTHFDPHMVDSFLAVEW
jgi:putative nucleotidyltransferase with HDIG domain